VHKLLRPAALRLSSQQLAAQRRSEQPDGEAGSPKLQTLLPRADPAALFCKAFSSPLRPPAAAAAESPAPSPAAAAGQGRGAAEAPAAPGAESPAPARQAAQQAPLPSLGLLASQGYSYSPGASALQALLSRDPSALAGVEGFSVSREGVRSCLLGPALLPGLPGLPGIGSTAA
jgi:hypothetical protein